MQNFLVCYISHTKCHVPTHNALLIITIKSKPKYRFLTAAMLFYISQKINTICIFFTDIPLSGASTATTLGVCMVTVWVLTALGNYTRSSGKN
jgi:hypothetical protein